MKKSRLLLSRKAKANIGVIILVAILLIASVVGVVWYTGVFKFGSSSPKSTVTNTGTVWWQGADAPTSTTGKNGDYYFDTSNNYVYNMLNGKWVYIANLTGTMGSPGTEAIGPQGIQGLPGTNGANGINGISANQPIGAYSFLIGSYGNGTYYAQNGTSGLISWTSTNAANVINNCTEIVNSTVFLANGFYPLQGGTILLADNVQLIGQSWSTIIQISPNSGYSAVAIRNLNFSTNSLNFNITVRNLQIDGNVYNQNITNNNHQKAIEFQNVTNGLVDHVYAHDTCYDLIGAWYGSKNCIFQYNTLINSIYKNGIFIEASGFGGSDPTYRSYSNKILYNHIMNAGFSGIMGGDGGTDTEVIGNDVENSTNAGIYISTNTQGENFNSQYTSNILNNNYIGMLVVNSSGITISNNVINGSQSIGISADLSSDLNINNNNFYNNGWNTSLATFNRYDISLTQGVISSTIQNNVMNSPLATGGIRVSGPAIKILSNTIQNGTNGIVTNTAANDVVIANNLINGTISRGLDLSGAIGANVYGNTFINGGYGAVNGKAIYLEATATQSSISNNLIDHWGQPRTGWGIEVDGYQNTIQGNMILDSASSGLTMKWGIYIYGSENYIYQNTVYNCSSGKIIENSVGTNTFKNNPKYNPVGYISSPINNAGGNLIVDAGTNATWVSTSVYTNMGSPKILYISGGNVAAIAVNGQTLFTSATNITITLQPYDTFSVTFSSPPTIFVMGQ